MSWFVEYKVEEEQHRIELMNESLKIGRGSASDTKIPDTGLSRVHCELTLENGVPVLRDLGSSSGTFVGNQRVDVQELSSGQKFRAGNTLFTLVSDSPLDAPTAMVSTAPVRSAGLEALVERFEQDKSIDRFILKHLVNKSGRSLVYRAVDPESDEAVAIKVMPLDTDDGEEDKARFMRAMKMLQELRDPCLVRLLRAGWRKRYCWVAMEWFPAGSIRDRIERFGVNGCLDWKEAWRIASCISQSLHVLERADVVHRNIRTTNILHRGSDNCWVLSDLIVAKTERTTNSPMITQQVFLPDDLAYTAPERLLGSESNSHSLQADIYSLGAVLTEVLTGEPPYGRGKLRDMLPRLNQPRRLVNSQSQLGINELVVDLVNRLTDPDPLRRHASAVELWQHVERIGKLSGMQAI